MFYSRFLQSVELWPDAVAVEIQRQLERANPETAPVSSQKPSSTPGSACCSEDLRNSYTYRELRQRAESVGAWLQHSGLQPGARCAILANNSPDWVAVYLGVIAAGHTAVPLDTAFNCEQVEKLLHDCGASLIFADAKHLPIVRYASPGHPLRIALIDDSDLPRQPELPALREMYRAGVGGFTPSSAKPDDVACILYTSGTTSDPKGVMLSHANLRGEMESVFRFVRLDSTDAILGVLPLFHALAQMINLMLPMACGARVVFLEALNTSELLRALSERNITIFCCVPQFFYLIHERVFQEARKRGTVIWAAFRAMLALSRAGRELGLNPGKVFFKKVHTLLGPKMRYLCTGGSRFDVAIGRDFHALGFDFLQAYGLTETTGGALATPPESNVIGSVGKPLPGNQAKIVAAKPAEDGSGRMVGEIAIRGPVVMKGYYNRPEATAEVIRDGWLHTGDLAYTDAGGNFFITGRQKEIIVLSSGKNIYPEEIESYYLKSPWIQEACVMGLEGAPGDPVSERLHAVIVPNLDLLRQKKVVNMREVIRYDVENISSHLPAAKRILSYDIWQEDLPRTTTRKLRRFEIESRVRRMQASGARNSEGQLARELTDEESVWMSQPEVQQAIAIVHAAAKNSVARLHPRDNLELDLGLDSMERVELLVQLEHQLSADVENSAASEVYTVRELIDLIRGNMGKGATQAVGWETLLANEANDSELAAITKERPITGRLWYLLGRIANLFAKDVFHLKVSGIEKLPAKGPFILCANHQSYLDAPVLTAAMPWQIFRDVFYVGDSEKFGSGPARTVARFLRLIPVDPDANLVPAMRAGAYGLRRGKILVLYPEGERSIDGIPKSFKKGAAILARHLNVPIVPVAQDGFFEAWPRGRNFQRFAPLRIAIGDAIYPDPAEAPEEAYQRLTAETRRQIVSMWEQLRAQRASHPPANLPGSKSAAEKHRAMHS
jgi:long-chain acyl-CoA synthetase